MKTAVVLMNLGGPDSAEAIRPFLMNFFMDPNIIPLPKPLRFFIARSIANRRSRKEAKDSYGMLGNRSPLLENSRAQALALEQRLNMDGGNYKTFVHMRYWHPMAEQVVREVRDWGAERVILLPLYPQFSTTTTWSSLGVWEIAAKDAGLELPTSVICCYPLNDGFIAASVENIRAVYEQALKDGHAGPRLLFSAHGLPENVIKGGDPYQKQCEDTAQRIVARLDIPGLDWAVCYQSRVGRLKWIGPALEDELERAALDRKAVVIYPHSFTQEHVETLVELDIEYKEKAHEMSVPAYYRVQTVSSHSSFIRGLESVVREHQDMTGVFGENGTCLCDSRFRRCCMRASV